MDDMTEEARAGRDAVADLEQRLRKRIHDLADAAQAEGTRTMLKITELEGWRREHTVESKLRGEAIIGHLERQDVERKHLNDAVEALKSTQAKWSGAILVVVGVPGAIIAIKQLVTH